ncbi:MFS transporter [Corynebacterium auriscanis]|uniref:MFS transporter n=1 Tax=Corynebacterium auriscanis TaxID=99807 RepID=UPI003CEC7DCA
MKSSAHSSSTSPNSPAHPSSTSPSNPAHPSSTSSSPAHDRVKPPEHPRTRPSMIVAILAVLAVGLNLRPGITGVAFVLPGITEDFHLGSTAAGLLTTVPILAFVFLSSSAPRWGHKFGVARCIMVSLLVLLLGFALRLIPSVTALYIGMAVVGVAITIGNVLLPTYIKHAYHQQAGTLTAVYTVSLFLGPLLAALGTIPLTNALGSWRWGLFAWAGLILIAIPLWLPHMRADGKGMRGQGAKHPSSRPLWSNPITWAVTTYFAILSVLFYTISAWLPTILTDRGIPLERGSSMLAIINFTAIPLALLISLRVHNSGSQRWATVTGSALLATGILGMIIAPTSTIVVWAIVFGMGNGVATGVGFSLPLLRSANGPTTATLAALSQTAGYTLSAMGPITAGFLHDQTNDWMVVLWVLFGMLIIQGIAGMIAGRNISLDITGNSGQTVAKP